jgi:hypothetical protein
MMRNSSMKRSGFASHWRPREKTERTLTLAKPTAWRIPARIDAPPIVTPKHDYVRSEALMRAYRTIPCQHCGLDDGTVCGAHCNWGHGKGGAIKADDNRCASLCIGCHFDIDQGSSLTEAERKKLWAHAHAATVTLLVMLGSWPAGVEIPDTSELLESWG